MKETNEKIETDHNSELVPDGGQQKGHIRQKNIYLILLLVVAILIPTIYVFTMPPSESLELNQGPVNQGPANQGLGYAPDFSSVDVVTGETISLNQYSGNAILLNFVNYGCNQRTNEIVSEQLLIIKSLKEKRDDFIPISVFCGCCPVETLRNFANQNGLSWPWLLDSDYSVVNKYSAYVNTYGYPTLLFIDKNQQIVEFSGFYDEDALSLKIDEMLG